MSESEKAESLADYCERRARELRDRADLAETILEDGCEAVDDDAGECRNAARALEEIAIYERSRQS